MARAQWLVATGLPRPSLPFEASEPQGKAKKLRRWPRLWANQQQVDDHFRVEMEMAVVSRVCCGFAQIAIGYLQNVVMLAVRATHLCVAGSAISRLVVGTYVWAPSTVRLPSWIGIDARGRHGNAVIIEQRSGQRLRHVVKAICNPLIQAIAKISIMR